MSSRNQFDPANQRAPKAPVKTYASSSRPAISSQVFTNKASSIGSNNTSNSSTSRRALQEKPFKPSTESEDEFETLEDLERKRPVAAGTKRRETASDGDVILKGPLKKIKRIEDEPILVNIGAVGASKQAAASNPIARRPNTYAKKTAPTISPITTAIATSSMGCREWRGLMPWSLSAFAFLVDNIDTMDTCGSRRLVELLVDDFLNGALVRKRAKRRARLILFKAGSAEASTKKDPYQFDDEDFQVVARYVRWPLQFTVAFCIAAILHLTPEIIWTLWQKATVDAVRRPNGKKIKKRRIQGAPILDKEIAKKIQDALKYPKMYETDNSSLYNEFALVTDRVKKQKRTLQEELVQRLWSVSKDDLVSNDNSVLKWRIGVESADGSYPPERKFLESSVCNILDVPNVDDRSIEGCDCSGPYGNCMVKANCKCLLFMKGWAYEWDALRDFIDDTVYECAPWCKCSSQVCQNRLVQNAENIERSLIIKETKMKGWGLFAKEELHYGAFVGLIVGEFVSVDKYHVRQKLFETTEVKDLRFLRGSKRDIVRLLDSSYYCNHTRFINHSCSPNVRAIQVFTTHRDEEFPQLAIFTKTRIERGVELTIDYREHGPDFSGPCHCGHCAGAIEMPPWSEHFKMRDDDDDNDDYGGGCVVDDEFDMIL